MPATRVSSIPLRRGLNAIMASWQRLIRIAGDRYRPELYYMRGPGPKWHAKHQAGSASGNLLCTAPGSYAGSLFETPAKATAPVGASGRRPIGIDIGWRSAMNDLERANEVMQALRLAEGEPAQKALPILNGLVGLVKADHDQRLEVEEARSGAFLAICEIGKALHRGEPADHLWGTAIQATERWIALARIRGR
jgi:hypothetical protein